MQEIDSGENTGKVLVLGWGSTFGSIKSAVSDLIDDGYNADILPSLLNCRPTDRVSPASVKAGATGANAAGVTAKLVGCIR